MIYLYLLFLFQSLLYANQEFTLYVKTKNLLKPLYLEFHKDPAISIELSSLAESIITFDMTHSGFCEKVAELHPSIDQLLFYLKPHSMIVKIQKFNKVEELIFPISSSIQSFHEISDRLIYELYGEYGIFSDRILYAQKEDGVFSSDLFIKNFDQHNATQITDDHHYKISPLFLSQKENTAEEILYVSYENGLPKLYKHRLSDQKKSLLIDLRGSQFLPALSLHGEFLSFISDASGSIDLFIQRLSKTFMPVGKPLQIFSSKNSVQASSTFDPKNANIAFVSDFEKRPKVYQLNFLKTVQSQKNQDVTLLSPSDMEASCPCYSPDGKKLAYSALVDGIRQIFIYDLDLNIHYALTSGPHHKENPYFAANSLHLAYNTTSTEHEIYVINLNQKTPVKITQGKGEKHYPCWERVKKRKIKDSM